MGARTVGAVCCALLMIAVRADAQRAPRSVQTPSRSGLEVRAELASVLLSAKRYNEAANEYRTLVAAQPGNHTFRLGLARALAWGDHPREAERELLQARDQQNAAIVETLLRSVRDSFEPTAAEAGAWVREAPTYAPYRVALARALGRESPARAVAQFDTLRFGRLVGTLPPQSTLLREEADAYAAGGNRPAGIALLRGEVARVPGDSAMRHALAAALFDDRQFDGARAQYDTLIAAAPSAPAYVGRANVFLQRHDSAAAEADFVASVSAAPNADVYLILGGMARGRDDLANAHVWYDAAQRISVDPVQRRDIAAARAGLIREERPVTAFAPSVGEDPGWRILQHTDADNAGVAYTSLGARRAFALIGGFVSDVDVGAQRITQHDAARSFEATGMAADAGIAREAAYGPLLVRGDVRGGVLAHPGIANFPRGSLTLAAWLDAWEVALDLSHDPAYESLLTTAALSPPDSRTRPLTAETTHLISGGPLGPLDVAASWGRMRLSDGNVGLMLAAYGRLPLDGVSRHLFAVYNGEAESFGSRSTLYWDPMRYVTHAVGAEVATHSTHGWSVAVRALPGVAFSRELNRGPDFVIGAPNPPPANRGTVINRSAFQLTSSGDATYRASWWEGVVGLGYGRARAGDYQRVSVNVAVRVLR